MKPAFIILFVTGLLSAVPAFSGMIGNVEYLRRDGISLKLDVSVPDGAGPFPIAILLHGGGNKGDKQSYVTPLFSPLTEASFTWFTIDFRPARYGFAAQVDDIETAVRWIKAHADQYKGDPRRVVLIGESTGGILACDVAGRASAGSTVNAVVAFYTPADLSYTMMKGKMPRAAREYWGIKDGDELAVWMHDYSPITYAKPGLPPFLLIHGTNDPKVPYVNALRLQKALKEAGVRCDLITIKGGDHGMSSWDEVDPGYKTKLIAWLGKTLPKP